MTKRAAAEAPEIAALDHPNICTVYEIDETEDGELFLAMACYDGGTLKQRIARGPLPLEGSLDIARNVAQGLARAHESGIVHRDVSPDNVKNLTAAATRIGLENGLQQVLEKEMQQLIR